MVPILSSTQDSRLNSRRSITVDTSWPGEELHNSPMIFPRVSRVRRKVEVELRKYSSTIAIGRRRVSHSCVVNNKSFCGAGSNCKELSPAHRL
jgi:hypothetical protein